MNTPPTTNNATPKPQPTSPNSVSEKDGSAQVASEKNGAAQTNSKNPLHDEHYQEALHSIEQTLNKLRGCSTEEKEELRHDFHQLSEMASKLTNYTAEIVVFGEISTGKSALINALIGDSVADVNVRGGWTKEIWRLDWEGAAHAVAGLADSKVVLIDTPGLNEIGGEDRATMAREAAQRADLLLFVVDSDINDTEYSSLLTLAAVNKPIIFILNKIDLYPPDQREQLIKILREERLCDIIDHENFVTAAANPREVEYVIETSDGATRSEWRKPEPKIEDLKARILEVLEKEGLALLALNAAMYAADKSDRIAAIRVRLREKRAKQVIWSYAGLKAIAVAVNPAPVVDVLGGTAVDVAMVATLARIYGLEMSGANARKLAVSILQAAGLVMLGELATTLASSAFKAITFGWGAALTMIPQGAAAGFGSYIVGQAAKYYFEHGASWGGESPKAVIKHILDQTDKQSVLHNLKEEIKRKMRFNPHASKA